VRVRNVLRRGVHRQIDADGFASHRVERVDERMVIALVERVYPAAVAARGSAHRVAVHLDLIRPMVADHVGQEPMLREVVRAHLVLGDVVPVHVLDQIERQAVG
jgi:hypothetical protein